MGVSAQVQTLDLADSTHFSELANRVHSQAGSIDFLINNGGISQRSLVFETQMEVERKIMEVNYFGTIALTKAVLPFMKQNGGGQIAVTSSLTGIFGFPMRSAYAASKHALHGFFETLQLEENKNNIYVTVVCPGRIKTDISKNAIDKDGKEWGKSDEGQEKGMPVERCAQLYLNAIKNKKKEVVIGSFGEKFLAKTRHQMPPIFYSIAKKISAT